MFYQIKLEVVVDRAGISEVQKTQSPQQSRSHLLPDRNQNDLDKSESKEPDKPNKNTLQPDRLENVEAG